MKLKVIDAEFSVCKIKEYGDISAFGKFCFIGVTDEENSLVCETKFAPENALSREDNWRCFRIEGELDFSLIGILSKISAVLAENKIGIFAVSTYNTDYILTKQENFERALAALSAAGYDIER